MTAIEDYRSILYGQKGPRVRRIEDVPGDEGKKLQQAVSDDLATICPLADYCPVRKIGDPHA